MRASWNARVDQRKQSYTERVEKQTTGYPQSLAEPYDLEGQAAILALT